MSIITGGYTIVASVAHGAEINYSYAQDDPFIESVDIGYSYSDVSDDLNLTGLVYNGIAPATQKIMNNVYRIWQIILSLNSQKSFHLPLALKSQS